MSLSHFSKIFSSAVGTLSLITAANLIVVDSAGAFGVTLSNTNFDGVSTSDNTGDLTGWGTHGDVSTTTSIGYDDGATTSGTITPISADSQAIITTGYVDGTYNEVARDDDPFDFNESGDNPLDADTNSDIADLQTQLGLGVNAFSINRNGGVLPDPRISKEGSAMSQQFNVTINEGQTSFTVNFNWAYLTNDGNDPDGLLGASDFGFWNLGLVNGDTYTTVFSEGDTPDSPTNEVIVLGDSDTAITSPTNNNVYGQGVDYSSYSYPVDTTGLSAGTYTYRIGFGVIDAGDLNRTSALLIDDIEVVPFEFTPSTGIGIVLGFIGVAKLRRRFQIKK